MSGSNVRHELANRLAIVRANLEGMVDGVVQPTNERLKSLVEAISDASELLKHLRDEEEPG